MVNCKLALTGSFVRYEIAWSSTFDGSRGVRGNDRVTPAFTRLRGNFEPRGEFCIAHGNLFKSPVCDCVFMKRGYFVVMSVKRRKPVLKYS